MSIVYNLAKNRFIIFIIKELKLLIYDLTKTKYKLYKIKMNN